MKRIKAILKGIDCVALLICVVTFAVAATTIAVFTIRGVLVGVWEEIRTMWSHGDDRIILVVIAASFVWLAFRWKALNCVRR